MPHSSHVCRVAIVTAIMAIMAITSLMPVAGRAAGHERASIRAALDSITGDELQRHVDVLADDTFEGRESGTRGAHAASVYLVSFLKEHNIDSAGERGSYFQPFDRGYRNILGLLPGSDPVLSREVIVVGAHYDHVGYGSARNSFGPTGYIHNGADDNASGVAGLLELIDAFAQLPERPRRSIVFAFWDGEERGLIGSQYWVSDPTVELNRVVFAVNADMIGRLRDRKVEVHGTRTGTGLRQLISLANAEPDLMLDYTWEMTANSDHHTFFTRNIPSVMFHTGLHDDYHRPSDDAHKINAEGMRVVARLLFQCIVDFADREETPTFRPESHQETPAAQKAFEQPIAPPTPRLGVSWSQSPSDPTMVLTEVSEGLAGHRAGLRVGDRLMGINGEVMTDPLRLRYLVVTARQALRIEVERGPDKQRHAIDVHLDGGPSRVGIGWRTDGASPSAVFVTRVVLGSPAHAADLRVGDWIYEVDRRPVGSSEELIARFQTAQTEFEVMFERQGRVRSTRVRVEPLD